jgi:RNA polymerase sigma factor (sigma-70 family)
MSEHSITILVEKLKSDNRAESERAATELWTRYSARLLGLARQKLSPRIRRREDENDVLQSMYKSFCLRQKQGMFDLNDRNDLWKVLVAITENKALNVAAKNTRQRRDVRREPAPGGSEDDSDGQKKDALLGVPAPQPTPQQAAVLVDEFERRVGSLNDQLRQVALWKLSGCSNQEIAEKLGWVERTVERKLELIRKQWTE